MVFCGRASAVFVRVVAALLFVLLCGASVVRAQAGSKKPAEAGAPHDVLNAPPPAPPLTEQGEHEDSAHGAKDEAKPPARSAAKPSKEPAPVSGSVKEDAAAKPGASSEAADSKPAAASGKGKAGTAAGVASGKAAASTSGAAASGKGTAATGDAGGAKVGGAAAASGKGKAASADAAAESAPTPAAEGGGSEIGLAEPGQAPPPPPAVDGDFAGPGALQTGEADAATPQDDFAAEAQEYVRPEKREYSVRIDLLNWLLLGRLSVELEMSVWKYLTVSLTPVFVVAHSPIAINYAGLDDGLTQRSHGIGPLSGVSLGVGAWFWGEPFKGYVVRLEFTNYSYSYRSADDAGPIDRVDFTERRLLLFIGSHSRFGAFTFAGGFGLGYELNQQSRCGLQYNDGSVSAHSDGCKGKQQIALDRGSQERANLNGPLHPVYFQARFSIGVVF